MTIGSLRIGFLSGLAFSFAFLMPTPEVAADGLTPTIPRLTLARDFRTGGVAMAPPIPYGSYVKHETLLGRDKLTLPHPLSQFGAHLHGLGGLGHGLLGPHGGLGLGGHGLGAGCDSYGAGNCGSLGLGCGSAGLPGFGGIPALGCGTCGNPLPGLSHFRAGSLFGGLFSHGKGNSLDCLSCTTSQAIPSQQHVAPAPTSQQAPVISHQGHS